MCVPLQDFCPCENQCNNQMFTKKQYAKLAVVSCSTCVQITQHCNGNVYKTGSLDCSCFPESSPISRSSSRVALSCCSACMETCMLVLALLLQASAVVHAHWRQPATHTDCSLSLQRRAGPKGFGLYAGEDLAAGQFLIEYIGEVLEEEEYIRRKQYYIGTGQRHYYFMNIGNGEVIDACRKVCSSSSSTDGVCSDGACSVAGTGSRHGKAGRSRCSGGRPKFQQAASSTCPYLQLSSSGACSRVSAVALSTFPNMRYAQPAALH